MPDRDGDKAQDATPHRRQKARQEGHVAKSQDLGSAVLLLVGMLALLLSGEALVEYLARFTQRQLGGEPWLEADIGFATVELNASIAELASYVLPIMGLVLLAAVAVNLAQ